MIALLALAVMQADQKLIDALSNVKAAAGHRYAARDDKGNGLDCLKIKQIGPKDYLGIYHWNAGGVFRLKVARSSDLLHWKYVRDVDEHAHQGTISLGNKTVLAYEKDGPDGNWIRIRTYHSADQLLAGKHRREYDIRRSLSKFAEGTPSFEGVTLSDGAAGDILDLRFHYLSDSGVDRQASGTFYGKDSPILKWEPQVDFALNTAAEVAKVKGNFGDRDRFASPSGGADFELYEGQLRKSDWASWRIFWRRSGERYVDPLNIKSHGGSTAFANPTVTALTLPDGKKGLVVTLFIPSEGSAKDESGCLIYYFPI